MDLVHSFPFGKGILQNAAAPVHQLPARFDYKAWEDGTIKFRWGQSWKLQSNQAQAEQSTRLTTSNLSHMADKQATLVLKILSPIEVLFWTKSRGVSTLQNWAPHMTCSPAQVWIQTCWRQGNSVSPLMDTVISISPWIEPSHGSNFS